MAGVRGSWNGSGDVLYDVYRDGTLLLAGIAGLSFTDGNATPGLHTYGVVARNSVGSSVEAQASITVPSSSDVVGVADVTLATAVLRAASQGSGSATAAVILAKLTLSLTSKRTVKGIASLSAASLRLSIIADSSGTGVVAITIPKLTLTVVTASAPPINSQASIISGVTVYNGGHPTTAITLPNGTTWSNGVMDATTITNNTKQKGALTVGSNCTLNNCTVSGGRNVWSALRIVDGSTNVVINGGHYSGAGAVGIGGGGSGAKWTLTNVEIFGNGVNAHSTQWGQVPFDWECGGIKMGSHGQMDIHTCNIHNNLGGPGCWWDIQANGSVDSCTINDNELSGAMFEISSGWTCTNNNMTGNGYGKQTFGWGAAVLVSCSGNVSVHGNTINTVHAAGGHGNGITVVQQDRGDSSKPTYFAHNVDFHSNSITGAGNSGHFADSGGTAFLQAGAGGIPGTGHGAGTAYPGGICDAALNITFGVGGADTWAGGHNHNDMCGLQG